MPQKVRIALDAMGGDHGPSVVVPGAEISLERHPDTEFLLYGDQALIEPLLATRPKFAAVSRTFHTDVVVKMDDKPSQALRQGRWKSSMWLAIEAVKKGEADVAVSAGNTGALMAMAQVQPAHDGAGYRAARRSPALWPTLRGESIVLDVGASIGADAHHLVDLAIMGGAMARVLFDLERPTVGLLNIGVEEVKGLEEVRDAGRILREMNLPDLDYHRLRRRRRHRQGRGRRRGHRRLRRQYRAQDRGRHRQADRRPICAARWPHAGARGSAICWRGQRSRRCATRWIRARSMAACFSASTASSSRAMAAPTRGLRRGRRHRL